MGSDMPTTVWLEAQVDNDGLALTLVSEGRAGSTVEEANYYSFAQLQEMAGDMFSMSLTDETRESLDDARNDLEWARAFLDDMAETGESDESDESDESFEPPVTAADALSSDVSWERPWPQSGDVYVDTVTESEVWVINVHENETAAETRAIGRLAEPKDMTVAEESVNSAFPDDDPVVLVSNSDSRCYYVPVSRLTPRSTDRNA